MPMNYFLNIIAQASFRDEENPGADLSYYNTKQNPVPELEAALISGAKETDLAAANVFYQTANDKIAQDVGWLALTHDKLPQILAPRVQGFVHAVNVNYDFTSVWISE